MVIGEVYVLSWLSSREIYEFKLIIIELMENFEIKTKFLKFHL